MQKPKYSQLKAMLAITKVSLIASFRNPSNVVFSLVFPLVFIMVFGFIGNGQVDLEVAVADNADTNNPVYETLEELDNVNLITDMSIEDAKAELERGGIDAILDITKLENAPLDVEIITSTASADTGSGALFVSIVEGISNQITLAQLESQLQPVQFNNEVVSGREYKTIDFILPGQLGFALLSSGIFATAFVFIILKQTLVLKRFFATPIKRSNIILAEALSRLVFALMQATVIIVVGKVFFGFTLVHGASTFLQMLILSALGLIVFLGFGFFVSSVAKSEEAVPAIANLINIPQFLLAGTFFPIETFPEWLQPVSNILPLTYLNTAMRKVAFDGANLLDVSGEILILVIWGIIIYALVAKLFKWE